MKLTRGTIFRLSEDGAKVHFKLADANADAVTRYINLAVGSLVQVRKFVRKGRPSFIMYCDVIGGPSMGQRIRLDMHQDDVMAMAGYGLKQLSALELLAREAPASPKHE